MRAENKRAWKRIAFAALIASTTPALARAQEVQPPVTSTESPGDGVPEQVIYEVLHASDMASGITERKTTVVQDAGAFEELWASINKDVIPPPPAPEVDWSTSQVVAVFAGLKSTAGFGLELESAVPTATGLDVLVREIGPDPDAMVAMVLTSPYLLVKVANGTPVRVSWIEAGPVED